MLLRILPCNHCWLGHWRKCQELDCKSPMTSICRLRNWWCHWMFLGPIPAWKYHQYWLVEFNVGFAWSVPDGQIHCFAYANHRNAQHHVVAELGGLSHAIVTAMCDPLSHALQQSFYAVVFTFGSANHEGQRAVLGSDDATANWRINELSTFGVNKFLYLDVNDMWILWLSSFHPHGLAIEYWRHRRCSFGLQTFFATFGSIVLESMNIVPGLMPLSAIFSYVLYTMSLFGNMVMTKSDFFATSSGDAQIEQPLHPASWQASAATSNACNLWPFIDKQNIDHHFQNQQNRFIFFLSNFITQRIKIRNSRLDTTNTQAPSIYVY